MSEACGTALRTESVLERWRLFLLTYLGPLPPSDEPEASSDACSQGTNLDFLSEATPVSRGRCLGQQSHV